MVGSVQGNITAGALELRLGFRAWLVPRAAGHGLFFDAGCPALESTQVIKLGPPHRAPAGNFQGLYQRGTDGENAFDPYAGGDPAHGEAGSGTFAIMSPDYHTLEGLDPLPVPFPYAEIDPHGISRAKVGNVWVGV